VTGVQTCALPISDEPGHDDDEPDARLAAVQAAAVRPGGRVGAADGLSGGEFRLMDELPILLSFADRMLWTTALVAAPVLLASLARSEEHTSELQSRENLVCRLLLEKKK